MFRVKSTIRTGGVLALWAAALLFGAACSSGGGSATPTSTLATRSTAPVATEAITESPGDGASRLERLLATQGYNAYYEEIHPAMRKFIAKQLFLDCANKGEAGIMQHTFDSIEVGLVRNLRDAVFNQENYVPEASQPKVVTLALKQGASTVGLNRLIAVADGGWKWFMTGSTIQAYQAQRCPGEGQ
jgi:hypothetical protein